MPEDHRLNDGVRGPKPHHSVSGRNIVAGVAFFGVIISAVILVVWATTISGQPATAEVTVAPRALVPTFTPTALAREPEPTPLPVILPSPTPTPEATATLTPSEAANLAYAVAIEPHVRRIFDSNYRAIELAGTEWPVDQAWYDEQLQVTAQYEEAYHSLEVIQPSVDLAFAHDALVEAAMICSLSFAFIDDAPTPSDVAASDIAVIRITVETCIEAIGTAIGKITEIAIR